MISSPHLCPATPFALRSDTDRLTTERGDLFHACRYLASNQLSVDTGQFGAAVYNDAIDYYRTFADALDRYPPPSTTENGPSSASTASPPAPAALPSERPHSKPTSPI